MEDEGYACIGLIRASPVVLANSKIFVRSSWTLVITSPVKSIFWSSRGNWKPFVFIYILYWVHR
jgi:hypothetical protein